MIKIVKKYRFLLLAVVIACAGGCYFLFIPDKPAVTFELNESESNNQSGTPAVVESDAGQADGTERTENVLVHVSGHVVSPGVYSVPKGARVADCIMIAGGVAPEGDNDYINLAERVDDGQRIYVPNREENRNATSAQRAEGTSAIVSESAESQKKIGINSATKDELMSLSGIGEAKADAIIRFREVNGVFQKTEDIMKVSGIKENGYAKIRDEISLD